MYVQCPILSLLEYELILPSSWTVKLAHSVKKLSPHTFIVYGTVLAAVFDECRNISIYIIQFNSDYTTTNRKTVGN